MKTLTKLQLHITHKITNILLLRYSNDALSGNLWQNTKRVRGNYARHSPLQLPDPQPPETPTCL